MALFDRFRKTVKTEEPTKEVAYFLMGQSAADKKEEANLKGEVEKKDIKFNAELGEEHPFDFEVTEGLYKKFGFTTGVIDKIVDFVWGPGFFTESEDERAKDIIDQWMRDVNFDTHGRKWLREALIKGTGFLELGGKLDEQPQGVKVLNANRMFIMRDNKGRITGYNQATADRGRMKKTVSFQPFQVADLPFNQIGDCAYGLGVIFPAMRTIENVLQSEKDMHQLVRRKANVPMVATMGDKERETIPTQEAIDSFASKMQFMNHKTEWAISDDIRLSVLDFGKVGEKFDAVLKHDIDMLFFTFQVPEVLMGRGNIPEGLAKVQLEAFDRRVKSIQVEIEKVIETKIFRRVLQSNGIDSHVEFQWGQPSTEEVNNRINLLTNLLTNPLLNTNLRNELEKELAILLEIPVENIEEPEEEREREEEEEQQPIVPGGNENEFLQGEVVIASLDKP